MTPKSAFNLSSKSPGQLGQELLFELEMPRDEFLQDDHHIQKTLALIKAGASLDEKHEWQNYTALMLASAKGYLPIVKALIKAGADLDAKDRQGETALMAAAASSHVSCLKVLITADAKLDARNDYGETALMIAAEAGSLKTVKALVNAGAKLEVKDNDGKTALVLAQEEIEGNRSAESLPEEIKEYTDIIAFLSHDPEYLATQARAGKAMREQIRHLGTAAKQERLKQRAPNLKPKT